MMNACAVGRFGVRASRHGTKEPNVNIWEVLSWSMVGSGLFLAFVSHAYWLMMLSARVAELERRIK